MENSKEEQERRIEELDVELREALKERERVEEERMRILGMVEGVITSVRR